VILGYSLSHLKYIVVVITRITLGFSGNECLFSAPTVAETKATHIICGIPLSADLTIIDSMGKKDPMDGGTNLVPYVWPYFAGIFPEK
jgi:hypothetical protein